MRDGGVDRHRQVAIGFDLGAQELRPEERRHVWSWGGNVNGQLGDDTTVDRGVPVRVRFCLGVFADGFESSAVTGWSAAAP